MAQSNIVVRLSLKDQEVVKRGLENTGEAGERALRRIEAAGRAPSAGLRALSAASDELRGSIGGLADRAGVAGSALRALGGTGLAAAAGLAAVVTRAREVTTHFDEIADASQRAGVSTELMQALRQTFLANAATIPELNTVLEKTQQLLGEAAAGSEEAQSKLARFGVTSRDTSEAFQQAAQHIATLNTQTEQAAAVTDLFGDRARGLAPAITASADAQETMNKGLRDGTIAGGQLVQKYAELSDRQALLNEQSKALAAEGLVSVEKAWTNISTATQTAIAFAVRYLSLQGQLAEAQRRFWERQFSEPKPPGSGEPGASGDWSGAGGSASFRSAQDVGLDWRPEPAVALPLPLPLPRPEIQKPGGGGGRATREQDLGLEMGAFSTTSDMGLPLKDADAWATSVREASYELRQMQAVGDSFYAGLERITQKTEDASDATSGFGKEWDKALTVGSQAVTTLSDGLADVLVEGGKLEDMFESIGKQILKSAISTSIQLAINSAARAGGLTGFAEGGAVLAGLPQGVYDRPTLFPYDQPGLHPFARGVGLLGEAGPEAIMPLTQLPDGKLGVGAAGGGGNMTVNIHNNAGAKVTTEERKDEKGNMTIDVMIDAVEQAMASRMTRPGTALNRAYRGAANPVRAR